MARNGPPDDFNNQPTQFADYGKSGRPPAGGPPPTDSGPAETPPDDQSPQFRDLLDQAEPTPWYRRPAALAGWIATVLVLLGLIVFGLMELIHGGQGTSHTPSTSPSATPSTTTTTTPPTTTTTEPSTAPPTSSAAAPPAQQPTQQPNQQPNQQQPTHRHHLPPLPSVITIPEVPTVITLPPGLS